MDFEPMPAIVPPETDAEIFARMFRERMELFAKKNADYGDAWKRKGARGVLVRLGDKVDRLDQLLWRSQTAKVTDESILDTARDLANYADMLCLLLDRGNLNG